MKCVYIVKLIAARLNALSRRVSLVNLSIFYCIVLNVVLTKTNHSRVSAYVKSLIA